MMEVLAKEASSRMRFQVGIGFLRKSFEMTRLRNIGKVRVTTFMQKHQIFYFRCIILRNTMLA